MSEKLWHLHLESYLAVREAMGYSVRAQRKLLGEFLDFAPIAQTALSDRSVPNGLWIGLACFRRAEGSVGKPDV